MTMEIKTIKVPYKKPEIYKKGKYTVGYAGYCKYNAVLRYRPNCSSAKEK